MMEPGIKGMPEFRHIGMMVSQSKAVRGKRKDFVCASGVDPPSLEKLVAGFLLLPAKFSRLSEPTIGENLSHLSSFHSWEIAMDLIHPFALAHKTLICYGVYRCARK